MTTRTKPTVVEEALTAWEAARDAFNWADDDLRDAAALALTAAESRLNALVARRRQRHATGALNGELGLRPAHTTAREGM